MSTLSIHQFIRCNVCFLLWCWVPQIFYFWALLQLIVILYISQSVQYGGSSFFWDLNPLIDLRRVTDFQFVKLFPYCEHRIDSFQATHMPDQNLGISPLPGATFLVLLSYLLLFHTTLVICVYFSRSFVYLRVKLLSHRVYIIIFIAQW